MQHNKHPIQGKADQAEVEKKRKEMLKTYYDVFSTEQGKTVLEDLKTRFHNKSPIFDPESARKTDFSLGERNVVLFIDFVLEQAKK